MFIDRAKIQVRGGKGGDGCVSFRREKYIPRGGPDGGDGGRGGSVILRSDSSRTTLTDFHYRQHFHASRGRHGEGRQKTGRSGDNLVIFVPPGTAVLDDPGGFLLADLVQPGDSFCAARGGRGGRGNARFATPTRQAPRQAEPGGEGESRWLRLELRVMADVGLLGFPNVGKSTLLARLTAARPKIAPYPFTTLSPHLGVAELGENRTAVLADIPGLIEGAHQGAGLGDRFLQHLERTRVLVHLVDAASLSGREPLADYRAVRRELESFGTGLKTQPEVVVLSRCDLLEDPDRVQALADDLGSRGQPAPIRLSSVTGEGLDTLRKKLLALLAAPPAPPPLREEPREPVIRLRERRR
ncbi:MAG: GTPase ObgE [Acidobacteriota bacterium]